MQSASIIAFRANSFTLLASRPFILVVVVLQHYFAHSMDQLCILLHYYNWPATVRVEQRRRGISSRGRNTKRGAEVEPPRNQWRYVQGLNS